MANLTIDDEEVAAFRAKFLKAVKIPSTTEMIPIFTVDSKQEFEIINLMQGVSVRKLRLPSGWHNTEANIFLVVDWTQIPMSHSYTLETLRSIDILGTFYAYSFMRTDISFRSNYYDNIRYVLRGGFVDDLNSAELIGCNRLPFASPLATISWDIYYSDEFKKLAIDSQYFPMYFKFYDAILPSRQCGPIHKALEAYQFGFASSQFSVGLKVISIFTALEALFTKKEAEVSFRLATNIAFFLFPSKSQYKERLEFMRSFKKQYSLRSRAVHGGEIIDDDDEIAFMTIETFRRVMRKVIEDHHLPEVFYDPKKHSNFLDHLAVDHILLD